MDPPASLILEESGPTAKSPPYQSKAAPEPSKATSLPQPIHYTADQGISHDTPVSVEDRLAWPTNRCCYEELSPQEFASVAQRFALRDGTPQFVKWVMVHHRGRFAKHLLVVSTFRLTLLRHERQLLVRTALMPRNEYQLLHLREIHVRRMVSGTSVSPSTASLHLHFQATNSTTTTTAMPSGGQGVLHFDPGVHAESIVRLLQRLVHELRLVYMEQDTPTLRMPPDCHWREFFLPATSSTSTSTRSNENTDVKAAVTMAYRCFCDALGVPFRPSVTTRLQDCLATASVDFQYCLAAATPGTTGYTAPVGSGAPTTTTSRGLAAVRDGLALITGRQRAAASALHGKEVQALAQTLTHCPRVQAIALYDSPLDDVGARALFHALLSPSCALEGLELTNVRLSSRTLRMMQHVVLQSTIRNGSGLSPSGSSSCCGGVVGVLGIAGANGQVATAPSSPPPPPPPRLPLRRLDFSGNPFSMDMAQWLATILELLPHGLERLQLAQCQLPVRGSARLLQALKASPAFSSSLRDLDLSGNALHLEGTRTLTHWLTGAFALQRLDLSATHVNTTLLCRALQPNTILHESSLRALNLSYNRLTLAASVALGEILGKTQSLRELVLRGMTRNRRNLGLSLGRDTNLGLGLARRGLRKRYLTHLLGPMFLNTVSSTPCRLDLSENDLSGTKATVLAHLLDRSPAAARASLRLDHAHLTDKAAILLLHALRGCRTLDVLSLEGNGFTPRRTAQSYKRFHAQGSGKLNANANANNNDKAHTNTNTNANASGKGAAVRGTALEAAAGSALALLLGGQANQRDREATHGRGQQHSSSSSDAHSFTNLYQHMPKRSLPLLELNLRASPGSAMVFGAHVLTAAVRALASATSQLQVLNVAGNECGDALARALGEMLPQNEVLHVLCWDDNFTTVDGLFAFYDGLLRNRTLSVVQLPINDTRRILEEQKDPPREKLFSVLGKIFKATERNQAIAEGLVQDKPVSQPAMTKSRRRSDDKDKNKTGRRGRRRTTRLAPPSLGDAVNVDVDETRIAECLLALEQENQAGHDDSEAEVSINNQETRLDGGDKAEVEEPTGEGLAWRAYYTEATQSWDQMSTLAR